MKGYNFDFAMSAQIVPSVVKEIIKNTVEEQTGKKVSSMRFNTQSITRGIGMSERTETEFSGITVYFEAEA
jgi:hypothetical protein